MKRSHSKTTRSTEPIQRNEETETADNIEQHLDMESSRSGHTGEEIMRAKQFRSEVPPIESGREDTEMTGDDHTSGLQGDEEVELEHRSAGIPGDEIGGDPETRLSATEFERTPDWADWSDEEENDNYDAAARREDDRKDAFERRMIEEKERRKVA